MITRRHLITRFFATLPAMALAGAGFPSIRRWMGQHELRYSDLLLGTSEDKVFSNGAVPVGLENFIKNDLPSHIAKLTGQIVELGVHPRCSAELQSQFGIDRYMGVDIVSALDLAGVVHKDVRQLEDLIHGKAVVVWNDVGTWHTAPRSRFAALEWGKRNLQAGGIYIDSDAYKIPTDVDYSQFELLCKGPGFTVFKKI